MAGWNSEVLDVESGSVLYSREGVHVLVVPGGATADRANLWSDVEAARAGLSDDPVELEEALAREASDCGSIQAKAQLVLQHLERFPVDGQGGVYLTGHSLGASACAVAAARFGASERLQVVHFESCGLPAPLWAWLQVLPGFEALRDKVVEIFGGPNPLNALHASRHLGRQKFRVKLPHGLPEAETQNLAAAASLGRAALMGGVLLGAAGAAAVAAGTGQAAATRAIQAAPGLLRQLPDGSALALPSANLATLAQSSGWALRQHSIHSLHSTLQQQPRIRPVSSWPVWCWQRLTTKAWQGLVPFHPCNLGMHNSDPNRVWERRLKLWGGYR
ncbi:unnamed protein product [Effrenium voratum]|nr:unnamed protein product [Effrenium voratum]